MYVVPHFYPLKMKLFIVEESVAFSDQELFPLLAGED